MQVLQDILLALHMVGLAAIVGSWLTHFKPATVTVWQVYGAIIQVVTGLGMFGTTMATGGQINHMWFGIKFALGLIILVCALIGYGKVKKGQEVPTGLAHSVGGLGFLTIFFAVLGR